MSRGAFRVAPQALEVEKHILGGILLDKDAIAVAAKILKPADFFLLRNQVIFEAAVTLAEKNTEVDLLTVFEALKASGKFQEAGGDAYLREVTAEVVSSANMEIHAGIVKEKARRRELIAGYVQAVQWCYDDEHTLDEILAHNEALLMHQSQAGDSGQLIPMPRAIEAAHKEFNSRLAGEVAGVTTGLKDLDKVIRAFRPAELAIVAAGPAMGKSALILQIAKSCKQPVAMFTLEMLIQEQVERMLAQEDGRLDSYALSDKFQLERNAVLIQQITGKLAGLPIWMNDSSSITPPEILRQSRELQRKHGLGLILVDYLQLVEAHGNHDGRQGEVATVSKYLKRIANELRVPVIAVSSVSRSPEKRDDRRPMLSDLRESGQIDFDAHKVIFIYRDEIYNACPENAGVAEILVRKNKNGMTGMVPLSFRDKQTRFYDMEQSAKESYLDFIGRGSKKKGSNKPPPPSEAPPDYGRRDTPRGDW